MRTRAPLVFVTLAALTPVMACSLMFAPGEYGGEAAPLAPVPEGGAPTITDGGGGDAAETGPVVEAGPPAPLLHLLVIAGEDQNGASTNDVWSAPIDASGQLGAFSYLQPAPIKGPLATAVIADGKLLLSAKGPASRVIENVDFDHGPTSSWRTTTVASPAALGFGQFFAGTSIVTVGGQTQEDDGTGAGTTIAVNHNDLDVAGLMGTTYSALVLSTTKLPVNLVNVSTTSYKTFVYFRGDGDVDRSHIYVGALTSSLGAMGIVETTAIVDPGVKKAHVPTAANTCAGEGRFFIAGGLETDAVLFADIDETTGKLGTWKSGPKLPASGLVGAGCAVWNGALHLVGGTVKAARSASILRSKIAADGTMAAWETSSGQDLLAPRSNVLALTY